MLNFGWQKQCRLGKGLVSVVIYAGHDLEMFYLNSTLNFGILPVSTGILVRSHYNEGLVKGAILCFRNPSSASQKSKDLNKVLLLLQDLDYNYKVDRLLTGLTAQQKGATARWYSIKHLLYKLTHCELKSYTMTCFMMFTIKVATKSPPFHSRT